MLFKNPCCSISLKVPLRQVLQQFYCNTLGNAISVSFVPYYMSMCLNSLIKKTCWIHPADSISLRIQPPLETISRLVHTALVIISLNDTHHSGFKDKIPLSGKTAASYLGRIQQIQSCPWSLALERGHLTSGVCSLFWSTWNGSLTVFL